jgi:hypothetical protein
LRTLPALAARRSADRFFERFCVDSVFFFVAILQRVF